MIVRYTLCPIHAPIPGFGSSLVIPRPIMPVRVIGPLRSQFYDGHLDTGSDDILIDPIVATNLGINLAAAPERPINLVGRGIIRCRYAQVRLRITDGIRETYEWSAYVAFSPFPLRRGLWGFAGFLQYFNADFRGADWEVHLHPNRSFPGQQLTASSSTDGPP